MILFALLRICNFVCINQRVGNCTSTAVNEVRSYCKFYRYSNLGIIYSASDTHTFVRPCLYYLFSAVQKVTCSKPHQCSI